jgi:superfamily II DNA/RNA helicase
MVSVIHGDQTDRERDDAVARFQVNECPLCVCITQAGGLGISLHDVHGVAPRVSYMTPGWSAPDTIQALGRIRRVGGTPVVQTFVLIAGTIEERIYRAVSRKLDRIETLNAGDLV